MVCITTVLQKYPTGATCGNVNGGADGTPAYECSSGFSSKGSTASSNDIADKTKVEAQGICCDAVSCTPPCCTIPPCSVQRCSAWAAAWTSAVLRPGFGSCRVARVHEPQLYRGTGVAVSCSVSCTCECRRRRVGPAWHNCFQPALPALQDHAIRVLRCASSH